MTPMSSRDNSFSIVSSLRQNTAHLDAGGWALPVLWQREQIFVQRQAVKALLDRDLTTHIS